MDIGQEINKHLVWIEDIASLFGSEGVTEDKLREISQHDQCALGQWLDSERSAKYQSLPEFEALKVNHEAFHKLAGELVAAIRAEEEEQAMASYEQFILMSQTVIGHLKLLREKALIDGNTNDIGNT